MYDYLDLRQTERLKELVPYKALAPDADEIIKELDRLNNIINELEEIINYEIEKWQNTDDELMKARVQEDKHILDVIQELKDSD